jgi:serine/threonine protein kinase
MTERQISEKSIFLEALGIASPEERASYLQTACGDNQHLREEVEALLRAHDRPRPLLDSPQALNPTAAHGPPSEPVGSLVGPYKLLEKIGEGGFGVVFLAEQTEPVRRKVALKVLKPGMDTRQVVARFEAERQALAIMDHPNIAKVFDGGATPSGRPYFVMELVKGVPITDFCDQNQLTPRQRLELFISVCQAVQHAHQKGIIHRDLKPSNVLVSRHDTTPAVKVIDFGVAKALGQELTDKTLFTSVAQMVGTPLYMSPEQAGMSDLDIDTRSDIYSLGVLLYELLTGTTPFTRERFHRAAYDEIRRIIREEDPPRPSIRLSDSKDALSSISVSRHTEPGKLARLVRGELDWIVMKCLEKDRNRRYQTASNLAMDIQRYLVDEAILARPPDAVYRFRKFARRNRASLATAATVLATIIVGLAASTLLIAQERDAARDAARRESNAAAREHIAAKDADDRRAEAVRERERAETNLRSAREAVDRVFTLAAEKMTDQPHMEQIRRALLEDALEFYQGFLKQKGSDPLLCHETALAYLRVGRIQSLLGRLQPAEDPLRQAIALLQRLVNDYPSVPEYRSDLADAHERLARLFNESGLHRPQDSLKNALAALVLGRKLAADFPNRAEFRKALATHLTSVAGLYSQEVQDARKSEEHYLESLDVSQELLKESPGDLDVAGRNAWAHLWLGVLYLETDRFREAELELRRGLALRQRLLESRPNSLELLPIQAYNKAYLASLLTRSGRPCEAEALLREAIAVRERMIADYPNYYEQRRRLVLEQHCLENCLLVQGRRQEAEAMIRKSRALSQKLAADFPDAPETSTLLGCEYNCLGGLLQDTNRPQEAAEAFREVKRFYEDAVVKSPDPRPRWAPVHELAWFLADCPAAQFRDSARAAKLAKDALQVAPQSGRHWVTLGVAQFRAGQSKDAIASLQKSMEILAGGDSRSWFILAMAHGQLGNKADARKWYDRAVKWMEENQASDEQLRRYRAEAAELLGVKEKK